MEKSSDNRGSDVRSTSRCGHSDKCRRTALIAHDKDRNHTELQRRIETQGDALYDTEGLIRLAGDLRLAELIPCLRRIESWSGVQLGSYIPGSRRTSFNRLPIRRATRIAPSTPEEMRLSGLQNYESLEISECLYKVPGSRSTPDSAFPSEVWRKTNECSC